MINVGMTGFDGFLSSLTVPQKFVCNESLNTSNNYDVALKL